MKLIITEKKGAGLVRQGDWVFEPGQIPTRDMEFIVWCMPDDDGYKDFVAHCKTLF